MSRRGYQYRDPTGDSLPPTEFSLDLTRKMGRQQALAVVAWLVFGTPLPVIAEFLELPVSQVERLVSQGISKLRHPSFAQSVRNVWEDLSEEGDLAIIAPDLRELLDQVAPLAGALCTHCRLPRIAWPQNPELGGRPRKYCDSACRQAAYRARKKTGTPPSTGSGPGRHWGLAGTKFAPIPPV